MFEYIRSISAKPQDCPKEMFYAIVKSQEVHDICARINELYLDVDDKHTKAQLQYIHRHAARLKRGLPAFLFQGYMSGKPRSSKNAVPTGMVMLDLDNVGASVHGYWKAIECKAKALGVLLVHITPSGFGLRIVLPMPSRCTSIEAAQAHYARELGIETYDSSVKDLARLSFAVPENYLLYIDDRLFAPSPAFSTDGPPAKAPPAPAQAPPPTPTPTQDTTYNDKGEAPCFDGVPMSRIVEALLEERGKAGGPVEGDRNNTVYQLARDLRYLCDFNAERVAAAMPHWGLDDREVDSTVASAIKSNRNATGTPRRISRLVARLKREAAVELGDEDEEDEQQPLFDTDGLPPLILHMARLYPAEFTPAVVMASLPLLGTLATGLRAEYLDGKLHSPSFLTCIVAPQASGKSFAADMEALLMAPIERDDDEGRRIEREWMDKRRQAKGKQEAPPDPKAVIRIVSGTISNAMLLKRMDYAAGRHLFTFCDEIDTLNRARKAGSWSQKDDLLRQSFDNAMVGQDYISEESWSTRVRLYYNLLFCGTPSAVARFFDDIEGGLVSRVAFAQLPDRMGLPLPHFKQPSTAEKADIERRVADLMARYGLPSAAQPVDMTATREAIDAWGERQRREYLETQANTALEVFRRRAAVIGFRAGMLAAALWDERDGEREADFAVAVASYALEQQLALFGEKLNDNTGALGKGAPLAPVSLFSRLPEQFTVADIQALRRSLGLKDTNVSMVARRWVQAGMARKTAKGSWSKQ